MAKAVIRRPFLAVGEDLISFIDRLELRFGVLISRIFIGMEFNRLAAVGRFYLVSSRVLIDAEELVVVLFIRQLFFPFIDDFGIDGFGIRA